MSLYLSADAFRHRLFFFFLGVSFIVSYMRAGFLKIKPECKAGRADLPVSEANISAYKISLRRGQSYSEKEYYNDS